MSELTNRQRQIVEFIQHSQERSGIVPTQQEIADHSDFRSTNAVRQHLRLIKQIGFLEASDGNGDLLGHLPVGAALLVPRGMQGLNKLTSLWIPVAESPSAQRATARKGSVTICTQRFWRSAC